MIRHRGGVATADAHLLAEGPVWDPVGERVLWVDIPAGRVLLGVLRDDGVDVTASYTLPGTVGAVVPTRDGGLLVAARHGFATIEPDGRATIGPPILPVGTDSRLNDGACDPAGRFLVGSMALDGRQGQERLYRLHAGGAVSEVAGGLTLSNGLGWSPDGRALYHVDSVPGVVWTQPYDPVSGDMGPREQLLAIDDGTPDGLCVDTDGNLWIAIWGAGQVRCYSTDGRVLAVVDVPAPHTSSAAFVGPGRDRLLITTAREDLTPAQLGEFPDSGRLFLAEVGAVGVATVPWAGRIEALHAPGGSP